MEIAAIVSKWRNWRVAGARSTTAVLVGTWLLGIVAIGVVIQFEREVDETLRAQVLIAQMRNQEGQVLAIAFRPATAGAAALDANQAKTTTEMAQAKAVFDASLTRLARLGHSNAPA